MLNNLPLWGKKSVTVVKLRNTFSLHEIPRNSYLTLIKKKARVEF